MNRSSNSRIGSTSKLSTTKMIQEYCSEHQGEIYTNFCSAMTCVKPLCPQCIENHYLHHKNLRTQPQIDSFKTLRNKCIQKIGDILQHVDVDENSMLPNEISSIQEQSILRVRQTRDHCHKIVDSYFINLQNYIKKQNEKILNEQSDFFVQFQKISNIISQLKMLENKLQNHRSFLPSAQTIIKLDAQKIQIKVKQGYQSVQVFKQNQKDNLFVEKGYEKKLVNFLSKLVYYGNYENLESMPKVAEELMTLKTREQRQKSTNKIYQQMQQSKVSQRKLTRGYSQIRQSDDNFREDDRRSRKYSNKSSVKPPKKTIFSMNTFKQTNKRKFLHFFQNDENILHYLELESGDEKFMEIQLNIDFNIPDFHKSIATPKGDLYLIGGSLPNQINKSSKIYKYDFVNNTLIHQSSMIYGRSSHSICFNNKYIYIMGGFLNDQKITNKCQRYDITNKSIVEINPMNHSACSFACASFNGRFIYKFGGVGDNHHVTHFIQFYDEKQGYWQQVNPAVQLLKGQFLLPLSTSAAVQITQTQIMVMGGYDKDNTGHKQTYILKVQANLSTVIRDINTYSLPVGEGFWNNTPIIYQRMVFVLQNIAYGPDQCSENARKILVFDGQGWKSLN